ncbi:hypothetical protein [Zhongshania arctica]|uniref:Uncharacterized protein n=1 Tax=Zhongshania arctica TaxID=3238302 RepID=A0ABV3TT24_9GAMM
MGAMTSQASSASCLGIHGNSIGARVMLGSKSIRCAHLDTRSGSGMTVYGVIYWMVGCEAVWSDLLDGRL